MLKKLMFTALGAGLFVAGLTAADFWTKPYTSWTDQEAQKMITDSPWAERMQVETGGRGAINETNPDDKKGGPIIGNLTTPVVLLWQSALPVKQAMYGRPNATDEQKEILARDEEVHILRLRGLPGSVRAQAEDLDKFKSAAVIKIKGKPDLHPTEIQLSPAPAPGPAGGGGGKGGGKGFGGAANFDAFLVFAKDSIVADDKEFEFQTKLGPVNIRHKFKTKDMMYNGKLEL